MPKHFRGSGIPVRRPFKRASETGMAVRANRADGLAVFLEQGGMRSTIHGRDLSVYCPMIYLPPGTRLCATRASMARLNAGKSPGCRLVTQLPSSTTSLSTQEPPALRMSSWKG